MQTEPGDLTADEVQLPWRTALYGALAGALAALPVAAMGLADLDAAIIAFFGPVWTVGYCLLLTSAAVASDYLAPSWPRHRRWSAAMGAGSLLVVAWLTGQWFLETVGAGRHLGFAGVLRAGGWTLVGAAASALYGRVAGVAATQRADGRRLGLQMGALVAALYMGLDALLGGPVRHSVDRGSVLVARVLLVVCAGGLLGLVLSWQVSAADRLARRGWMTPES